MRSPKLSNPWGSNFPNMRGKKTQRLHCQCCSAENRKEEERWKEAEKEIEKTLIEREKVDEV